MTPKKTTIEIKCNCGETKIIDLAQQDLEWDIVETDEREMGMERLHEAVFDFDCEKCDEVITVTLHVWEYPEGFCNTDDILVDGGELIEGCDLDLFIFGDYGMDEEA